MKILKNVGSFEVLSKTDDVISSIAKAARTCYKSEDKASSENDIALVKNLLNRGHEAMIEFADMTVKFTNVSRGFTHEMVRHRLVSFAQESTRYVDESDFQVVVPPHKNEMELIKRINFNGLLADTTLETWFDANEEMYRALRRVGWKAEDARQVLPTAIKADIVVKANLREWRHIFKMRCDKFAHWEIRAVMLKLLSWCQEEIPIIFDDFHMFDIEEDQYYARPIPSKAYMKDLVKHFIMSGGTFDDLAQDAKA